MIPELSRYMNAYDSKVTIQRVANMSRGAKRL